MKTLFQVGFFVMCASVQPAFADIIANGQIEEAPAVLPIVPGQPGMPPQMAPGMPLPPGVPPIARRRRQIRPLPQQISAADLQTEAMVAQELMMLSSMGGLGQVAQQANLMSSFAPNQMGLFGGIGQYGNQGYNPVYSQYQMGYNQGYNPWAQMGSNQFYYPNMANNQMYNFGNQGGFGYQGGIFANNNNWYGNNNLYRYNTGYSSGAFSPVQTAFNGRGGAPAVLPLASH